MKKLWIFFLALIMVAGALPVMAFEDSESGETDLTGVVNMLAVRSIVDGFPDGSYRLDEVATRAQLIKMLVNASGAAEYASDATALFSDVKGHWAVRQIASGNKLGIITGNGDGTFAPDAPVSAAQVATMALRTLGYNNVAVNGGSSDRYIAENYVSKAEEIGLILKTDAGDRKEAYTRRDAFLLVNQTLSQETVLVDADGMVKPTGKTLWSLADEDGRSQAATFYVSYAAALANTQMDLTPYLYEELIVRQTDDGQVVSVIQSNVDTHTGALVQDNVSEQLTVRLPDNTVLTLPTASAVHVFYNGAEEKEQSPAHADSIACKAAKVVLNRAGAVCGIIYEALDAPVLATNAYINGKTKYMSIALPVDANGKVNVEKVVVTGDAVSLEDIKADDVLEIARATDGSAIKFVVTRNVVSGRIAKISDNQCYIDGTPYRPNNIRLSPGDEGAFYLDSGGCIAFFKPVERNGGDTPAGPEEAVRTDTVRVTHEMVVSGAYPVDMYPYLYENVTRTTKTGQVLSVQPNAAGFTKQYGILASYDLQSRQLTLAAVSEPIQVAADAQICVNGAEMDNPAMLAELSCTRNVAVKVVKDAAGAAVGLVCERIQAAGDVVTEPSGTAPFLACAYGDGYSLPAVGGKADTTKLVVTGDAYRLADIRQGDLVDIGVWPGASGEQATLIRVTRSAVPVQARYAVLAAAAGGPALDARHALVREMTLVSKDSGEAVFPVVSCETLDALLGGLDAPIGVVVQYQPYGNGRYAIRAYAGKTTAEKAITQINTGSQTLTADGSAYAIGVDTLVVRLTGNRVQNAAFSALTTETTVSLYCTDSESPYAADVLMIHMPALLPEPNPEP